MKVRSVILVLASLVVLASFTVVAVHTPDTNGVKPKQGTERPAQRTEPLGGFVAEDRL